MNQQLALAIQLKTQATLDNFCWDKNTILRHQIELTLAHQGERFLYIWGDLAAGKSHLLQGICHRAMQHNMTAIYLPLKVLKEWGPECIEDLSTQSLIVIDDIDAIAGSLEWENALFNLYNQIYDNEQSILFTSNQSPPSSALLTLPDLRSRLNWGLVLQLKELEDANKIVVLQDQAQQRGIDLPDSVAIFLIQRCTRNMNELQRILDRLDQESLIAQRKITIPFVKWILEI